METTANTNLFVKMTVSAWETECTRVTKLLNELSDEQLMKDTAPGRNSGKYLLGHLTAVSDNMQTLLEWGEVLFPQLVQMYIRTPDKSGAEGPSINDLRDFWKAVNERIAGNISKMKPEDWFAKHTAVSAEDFLKEPHRNKLNVLISRTNHMSYHRGQLVYLSKNVRE